MIPTLCSAVLKVTAEQHPYYFQEIYKQTEMDIDTDIAMDVDTFKIDTDIAMDMDTFKKTAYKQ